jgi:hypothetical protein
MRASGMNTQSATGPSGYTSHAQSIQSDRLSLQSSELAPPAPLQEGDTLACEGGGEGANSDEGTDTLVL